MTLPIQEELNTFFYPRNIAVIGVSPEPDNLGKNIVKNLFTFGYEGEVLSVGRKEGVVFGQRIYRSLRHIDHAVDLAVILTPAGIIPGLLEECGRKGIKRVVIESGGFSEMSADGLSLEQTCLRTARKYGMRIIGPNGIGVINLEKGLSLPFPPLRRDLLLGPVSILTQSGGVGLSYLASLAEEAMGLNKFVSLGNKLDVGENELLEYLINDEGTRVILLYLESFVDGRRFVEIASKSGKPILVYKSNRFSATASIARSHTAALSADDRLVDSALEQAGCIRLNALEDAMDYIKSQTFPPLNGKRLAIISRSGGHAVIAMDACAYYGFELADLPETLLQKVRSHLRANVISLQNPLDLGDVFELEFYGSIVEEMLKGDAVDGILLGHEYRHEYEREAIASRAMLKRVEQLMETYRKPVAPVILTEPEERNYLKKNLRLPIFSDPENAMRAFNLSYKWMSRRPSPVPIRSAPDIRKEQAEKIIQAAAGRDHFFLSEALDLLRHYGFALPPHGLAAAADEAVSIWQNLKSSVALKINRPHILHKSDQGAVKVNLDSAEQIRSAFRSLQDLAGGRVEVVVQAMAAGGRETILGGKRDDVFGAVVLFGLGGVFVEILEDVALRVAPISHQEARRMVSSTKGARILDGTRGETPYDRTVLEDLLVRVSQMLVDLPAVREIDINPVMVFTEGRGAQALDARVILSPQPPAPGA
jgi:acetyltransferase